MAYTINKTNGTIFATVPDGTINTDSSQVIVGKNYAGYGEFLGENFIRILENAANNSAPLAPLAGQLWFDTSTTVLKVFNGVNFKNLGAASSDVDEPDNPVIGDLWYDPTNKQLKVYTGDEWLLVGPAFTSGSGVSGAIVDVIDDEIGNPHTVVKIFVEDEVVGIWSKDVEFAPGLQIDGFPTINPGLQLATSVNGEIPLFEGTAREALNLLSDTGEIISTDKFIRNDLPAEEMTGSLWIKDAITGLRTGVSGELQINAIGDAAIRNNSVGKAIVFLITKVGGSGSTPVLTINGDGEATVDYVIDPALTANNVIVNKQYVDTAVSDGVGAVTGVLKADGSIPITGTLYPALNDNVDLGATATRFQTVYANTFSGTAVNAQYADLAERFETDKAMPAGTVVALGGVKEITKAMDKFSDDVFGVISTNAAYLMNSAAGEDDTHPAVAMNGRVPVRVIGKVNKGDRLVSAGNGLAQSANSEELTPFNVIGRALESKDTDDEGVVEAIVRIN